MNNLRVAITTTHHVEITGIASLITHTVAQPTSLAPRRLPLQPAVFPSHGQTLQCYQYTLIK